MNKDQVISILREALEIIENDEAIECSCGHYEYESEDVYHLCSKHRARQALEATNELLIPTSISSSSDEELEELALDHARNEDRVLSYDDMPDSIDEDSKCIWLYSFKAGYRAAMARLLGGAK
jgi:hypothetical protein